MAERQFFETTSVWSSSHAKNRLGTGNLTESLSRLLSSLINKTYVDFRISEWALICLGHRLPKLRDDAMASRQQTRQALDALPPPLSDNPSAELLKMVQRFCSDFENYVRGLSHFESLIQHCKPAFLQLSRDIRATAPNFRPYTAAELGETNSLNTSFDDLEEDEQVLKSSGIEVSKLEGTNPSKSEQDRPPQFIDEIQVFVSR